MNTHYRTLNRKVATAALVVFLGLGWTVSQVCAHEVDDSSQTHASDDVPYISGGVGEESRKNMQAAASQYNLKLGFAATAGNFVADVNVQVQDRHGHVVLEAVSDGPWFYAALPAGTYKVTATYGDRKITKTISVPKKGGHLSYFYWKEKEINFEPR